VLSLIAVKVVDVHGDVVEVERLKQQHVVEEKRLRRLSKYTEARLSASLGRNLGFPLAVKYGVVHPTFTQALKLWLLGVRIVRDMFTSGFILLVLQIFVVVGHLRIRVVRFIANRCGRGRVDDPMSFHNFFVFRTWARGSLWKSTHDIRSSG